MDFTSLFHQLSKTSVDDAIRGFQAITFGGTGEAQPYPYRGTPNPHETSIRFVWNADGTLTSDKWWLRDTIPWMNVHYEVPLLLALVYYCLVFGIQRFMRDRPPATFLDRFLPLWNLALALFSIVGFLFEITALHDFVFVQGNSFGHDCCVSDRKNLIPTSFLFCLSKIPELIDTLFLVLRKRPVIFLHWYHHIVTMIYCWDAWALQVSLGGYFALMNYFVHSFMYTYYFFMAKPFGFTVRFPSFVPFCITVLQIAQMIGGLAVLYYTYFECRSTYLSSDLRVSINILYCILMYFSFLILFVQLFLGRYLSKKQTPPDQKKTN